MRILLDVFPFQCFGGIFYQHAGNMSALSIRMETLTKGGMTASTVTAVLSHWTPAEANKWMTENTEVVHLSQGDVAFFPFMALLCGLLVRPPSPRSRSGAQSCARTSSWA